MNERLDKMERKLDKFLSNEWPHLASRVGRVEGAAWLAVIIGAAVLGKILSGV